MMACTRFFKYVFSNNSIRFLSPEEADKFLEENEDIHTVFDGYRHEVANPPRIRDGFQPGYQPNLGREVTHYDEYKRIVKQKGCVIAGNDKPGLRKKVQKSNYVTDSVLKNAVERGAKISGNEAAALKKGIGIHRK